MSLEERVKKLEEIIERMIKSFEDAETDIPKGGMERHWHKSFDGLTLERIKGETKE